MAHDYIYTTLSSSIPGCMHLISCFFPSYSVLATVSKIPKRSCMAQTENSEMGTVIVHRPAPSSKHTLQHPSSSPALPACSPNSLTRQENPVCRGRKRDAHQLNHDGVSMLMNYIEDHILPLAPPHAECQKTGISLHQQNIPLMIKQTIIMSDSMSYNSDKNS